MKLIDELSAYGCKQVESPQEMLNTLEMIQRQIKRIQEVSTLCTTSEITEKPSICLDTSEFNLSELITNIISQLSNTLDSDNIKFICEIKPDIFIKADQTLIMRAIINLLNHVLKSVHHNSIIKITVADTGSEYYDDTSVRQSENMSKMKIFGACIMIRILQITTGGKVPRFLNKWIHNNDHVPEEEPDYSLLMIPSIIKAHDGQLIIRDVDKQSLEYLIYLPKD